MKHLSSDLLNPAFSHIYIEKAILDHPITTRILSRFPISRQVEIAHYKDVFCRSRQNYSLQKKSPSLILAEKKEHWLYEGAAVCQDFGYRHFYYASLAMNCIYDCEYCYLQGMHPSAHIVVFVNLKDFFSAVERELKKHPVYLCISYDTDLLAMEAFLGYVKEWLSFAGRHPELVLEIRTKSANPKILNTLNPQENVILAWTLSPDSIREKFEHHTPSLEQRLHCIQIVLEKGFPVRICFDPLLYTKNWAFLFQELVETTFRMIPSHRIKDASVGVFRITQAYLKRLRKQRPNSAVVQYPFINDSGVCHYGHELTERMISFAFEQLRKYLPEDKLFIWKG
ncbi:MAG: radical SAM protein [Clostridiaceae bacterium]|nr:radical SAM protein [Clostridiaceae bacterium]